MDRPLRRRSMIPPSWLKRVVSPVESFVNKSFGEFGANSKNSHGVYAEVLLLACEQNGYVESSSNLADSLHRRIKLSNMDDFENGLFDLARGFVKSWRVSKVRLAIDITDEQFYGDVQGLSIHGWTGEKGVKGKFKFLTISIIDPAKNHKIPLISTPVHLGENMGSLLKRLLDKIIAGIKPKTISQVLMDRGFYTAEIIKLFEDNNWPYLILVPKHELFKNMLASVNKYAVVEHELTLNKHKTKQNVKTKIVLVKADSKDGLKDDWVFATNIELLTGKAYVRLYKKRWNIETEFRVEDEARIKTKSKSLLIRYFYYLVSQIINLIWRIFACKKIPFKPFITLITPSGIPFLKEKYSLFTNQ